MKMNSTIASNRSPRRRARRGGAALKIGVVAAALIALSGCLNPFTQSTGGGAASATGNAQIRIGGGVSANTVIPEYQQALDNVDRYNITLERDGYESRRNSTTSVGTVTMSGVPTGTWDVTVDAVDDAVGVVARGTDTITITAGGSASVQVDLQFFLDSGEGTVRYTVTYPASAPVAALQDSDWQVVDSAGDAVTGLTLNHDTAARRAVWSGTLPAGQYTFSARLTDNQDTLLAYVSEALNVAGNLTSRATVNLTENQISGVPAAPSGVFARQAYPPDGDTTMQAIEVSWVDNSPIETAYEVRAGQASKAWYEAQVDGDGNNVSVTETGDGYVAIGANETAIYNELDTIAPNAEFTYEVRARNRFGTSEWQSVTIKIAPPTPVIFGSEAAEDIYDNDMGDNDTLEVTTREDTAIDLSEALQVSDPNGIDVISWTVTSGPANGTLDLTPSGFDVDDIDIGGDNPLVSDATNLHSYGGVLRDGVHKPTYTPNADWHGSESITVQVSDGKAINDSDGSEVHGKDDPDDEITITIVVEPVNDPPELKVNDSHLEYRHDGSYNDDNIVVGGHTQTVEGLVEVSSFGADDEEPDGDNPQAVARYNVSIVSEKDLAGNDADIIADAVSITNDGDLVVTSTETKGTAVIEVSVTDNGGGSLPEATSTTKQITIDSNQPVGQFTVSGGTAGEWTPPLGVDAVSVVAIGGGGGGSAGNNSRGGAGGAGGGLAYVERLRVNSDDVFSLSSGDGGRRGDDNTGAGDGETSEFGIKGGSTILRATGGGGASGGSGGSGGSGTVYRGGDLAARFDWDGETADWGTGQGGAGGNAGTFDGDNYAGGGGGAAGYGENGGAGADGHDSSGSDGGNGAGGGGASRSITWRSGRTNLKAFVNRLASAAGAGAGADIGDNWAGGNEAYGPTLTDGSSGTSYGLQTSSAVWSWSGWASSSKDVQITGYIKKSWNYQNLARAQSGSGGSDGWAPSVSSGVSTGGTTTSVDRFYLYENSDGESGQRINVYDPSPVYTYGGRNYNGGNGGSYGGGGGGGGTVDRDIEPGHGGYGGDGAVRIVWPPIDLDDDNRQTR